MQFARRYARARMRTLHTPKARTICGTSRLARPSAHTVMRVCAYTHIHAIPSRAAAAARATAGAACAASTERASERARAERRCKLRVERERGRFFARN